MAEREKIMNAVEDKALIEYFYLGQPMDAVLDTIDSLKLSLDAKQDPVPFNAQVKGYLGATDSNGHPWIVKPALNDEEVAYHRICALAYLLDHEMGSLASPITVVKIDGKPFRASKVVKNAMQISSYDYLSQPFIDILRADLVNRWLFFDEDRNPNNYLVIHNAKKTPFVVAIDYDKADLLSDQMKITGDPSRFGWFRVEKTRFLTLLRPEHFMGVPLECFEPRLSSMLAIKEKDISHIANKLLAGFPDGIKLAERVTKNILERREYIDKYFRQWFKPASETASIRHESEYEAFGASFLKQFDNK